MILLGIDTGGTFTDFVLLYEGQLQIHKVLSTPKHPEQAILQGIAELGLNDLAPDRELLIIHGSTVATNAVLEGKGARTVYITNRGMGDILTIGRQARRELYNLTPLPIAPPVIPELCLETGGRLGADGTVVEPLSNADIAVLVDQLQRLAPQSVAINLLFSFLDAGFEKTIAAAVPPDIFVSRSSAVLPEIKEYERGIATWLNASVGPVMQGYLQRLTEGVRRQLRHHDKARISVMQSSGGTIEAEQAAQLAVHMLLSGPAGGMAGAKFIAARAGRERILTFDMGGTSTDVALLDGEWRLTSEGRIGQYPVAVPMVDLHTIGAGGGSIAVIDAGGLLQVGPASAGADPGPACYAQGGLHATVTDANLLLGRLRADAFLGGSMSLDIDAARRSLEPIATALRISCEDAALGIIRLANENMVKALRVMSVQRGVDPRELTLVSFGGAGGLHVCALATALAMRQAMVPVNAGVLSALGMLVAPRARHMSQGCSASLHELAPDQLHAIFARLSARACEALRKEGLREEEMLREPSVDLRYRGQSYAINVRWQSQEQALQEFEQLHETLYGHRLRQEVELVTVRMKVQGPEDQGGMPLRVEEPAESASREPAPKQCVFLYGVSTPVAVFERADLLVGQVVVGPALITELVSTTWIETGWGARVDEFGNLLLRHQPF
jgi:N-methylhydantoinase A